jgi:hypothetical protein
MGVVKASSVSQFRVYVTFRRLITHSFPWPYYLNDHVFSDADAFSPNYAPSRKADLTRLPPLPLPGSMPRHTRLLFPWARNKRKRIERESEVNEGASLLYTCYDTECDCRLFGTMAGSRRFRFANPVALLSPACSFRNM